MYVPQILVHVLKQLEKALLEEQNDLHSKQNLPIYSKTTQADPPLSPFAAI